MNTNANMPPQEPGAPVANNPYYTQHAAEPSIDSLDAVNAFHVAALEAGAVNEGEPGRRPYYGPAYYGCFVRDPDGHKIEAMYWDAAAGLEAETQGVF